MMIFLNILILFVLFVNYKIGGNYMFLVYKLEIVLLFDMLGLYFYYIILLEFVVFIGCFILYMLFVKRERYVYKELLGL